jgi:excisionase family DNA binding protein
MGGMKQTIHPSERLLRLDEVAEYLGVDRMTIYYRLLAYEHLPGVELGKQWREKIEDCLIKNAKEPQEVNAHYPPSRSVSAIGQSITTCRLVQRTL